MLKATQLETDLIVARPYENDAECSWTLASRLGEMLSDAEQQYGERDKSYAMLGIEFCGDAPRIRYAGNRRYIIIQLSQSCLTSMIQACYQLAHECIHLLSPGPGEPANVLEEGLATHFAHRYVRDTFHYDMPVSIASYEAARSLVEQLLAVDGGSIKGIRERQGSIHKATAAEIRTACPECSHDLSERLAQQFFR
jgi:hypothetical protein